MFVSFSYSPQSSNDLLLILSWEHPEQHSSCDCWSPVYEVGAVLPLPTISKPSDVTHFYALPFKHVTHVTLAFELVSVPGSVGNQKEIQCNPYFYDMMILKI